MAEANNIRFLTDLLTGGRAKPQNYVEVTPLEQLVNNPRELASTAKPLDTPEPPPKTGIEGLVDSAQSGGDEKGLDMYFKYLTQKSPENELGKSTLHDYMKRYNAEQDLAINQNRDLIDQYNSSRGPTIDMSPLMALADIKSGTNVYSKAYKGPLSDEQKLKLNLELSDKLADSEKERANTNIAAAKALSEGSDPLAMLKAMAWARTGDAQANRVLQGKLRIHQHHMDKMATRPEIENTRKFFNIINDSVTTFANPKREFTPQSFEELQQNIIGAVRGMAGQSGVNEREAQKVVDQLNVGWPAFKQKWLGSGPIDLRKNKEAKTFIDHFLNQAQIELNNLGGRFAKTLVAKSKGLNKSFYDKPGNEDLKADLEDRIQAEIQTLNPEKASKVVEDFTTSDGSGMTLEELESLSEELEQ